jgi:hypothetical protein
MVRPSTSSRSETCVSEVVQAIIYFYKPIRLQLGRSLREQPDVHARLMSQYPQVPEWYYVILFGMYRRTIRPIAGLTYFDIAITFAFACICVSVWPTGLPIWALVLSLLIGTPTRFSACCLRMTP